MANAATLAIKVVTEESGVEHALEKVKHAMEGTKTTAQKVGVAAAVGFGGLVTVGLDSVKAAAEAQHSQEILATTMEKTTGATKEQSDQMEEWVAHTSLASGVAEDQLRPALENMLRATGNATESQTALQTAMDVSTATGRDLQSVSLAIAKGYAGNTTALGRLGLGIDKATIKSGNMGKIMAAVNEKVGGSTQKAAGTAEGEWKRMQVGIEQTKEALGTALLPAIQALLGPLVTMAQYLAQNQGLAKTLAIVGVILAGVLGTISIATKLWAAYQVVLDAAMAANPVVLIMVAVLALIVAIKVLWDHWAGLRRVVGTVMSAVLAAVRAVWQWIVGNWPLLLTILLGPIGAAAAFIIQHFSTIKSVVGSVFGAIVGAIKTGVGWVQTLGTIVGAVFGGIESAVQKVVDVFSNLFGAVGKVIDKIKSIGGGLLSHIPGLGGIFGSSASASGAYYSPPGVGARSGTAPVGAGGVQINVNGALDPQAVARQIMRLLNTAQMRGGRIRLANPVSPVLGT